MKRLLFAFVVVAGLVAVALVAQAEPDPETCEGYPEPRVFMENQTWVEPMPSEGVTHPGVGEQGHIHVSGCFPLYQGIITDTLELDVRIQLHNVPGDPTWLQTRMYLLDGQQILTGTNVPMSDGCDVTDCDEWVHISFPIAEKVDYSGWAQLQVLYNVEMGGEVDWYNNPRWPVFIDNGQPLDPTPMQQHHIDKVGGDTWLHNPSGSSGSYAEAWIARADYPWDETTGELTPISGIWELDAHFGLFGNQYPSTYSGFATLDPHLHADPVDLGTILYDGQAGIVPLSIDTTTLSDGQHRLLLATCNPDVQNTLGAFENCGVLVIRFLVENGPPPVVVDLEPGQSAEVNCPTTLTGTVESNEANLTCDQ